MAGMTLDQILEALDGMTEAELDREIDALTRKIECHTQRRNKMLAIRSIIHARLIPREAIGTKPADASDKYVMIGETPWHAHTLPCEMDKATVATPRNTRPPGSKSRNHTDLSGLPDFVTKDATMVSYTKRIMKYLQLNGPARPAAIASEVHAPVAAVEQICLQHARLKRRENGCYEVMKD